MLHNHPAEVGQAPMNAVTQEPVRLLIWDLDETFWHGTLTEGGMQYCRAFHDVVIELARRGIVSAICSKNDHARVQEILEREGIWEYFVFASINWDPKGPRIAAMVDAVQLRAPTVMFVDDNPMNLAEAQHYVPGIQVARETFIPEILESPLFRGKADPDLTRLKQYKLLEKRKADAAQAGGDNAAFLRESGIVVTIEHDLEPHIDRAIELINRTNQLNFTKRRLSEDMEKARAELRELLAGYTMQAGILRVRDRYGDYGYCGLYIMTSGLIGRRLKHFCFSCRILNMGVESWLYQRLGRPHLKVRGEVLTDILTEQTEIDWISAELPETSSVVAPDAKMLDYVFARGGCDLHAIQHYFKVAVGEVFGEFNSVNDGVNRPLQHSVFARYRALGMPDAAREAFYRLGYREAHFESALAGLSDDAKGVWVLSFWADPGYALYRHKATGLAIPVVVPEFNRQLRDMTASDADTSLIAPDFLAYLRENFTFAGVIGEAEFKENVTILLQSAKPDTRIFILLANEHIAKGDKVLKLAPQKRMVNQWLIDICSGFPNVDVLRITDFVAEGEGKEGATNHFDRMVYFKVFQEIMRRMQVQAVGSAAE